MKTGAFATLVAMLFLSTPGFTQPEGLREAPPGFTWKACEKLQEFWFLVPDGWFFKEEEREGTVAVFITKEPIEREGWYRTGFSVNAIQQSAAKTGVAPSSYAQLFMEKLAVTAEKTWGFRRLGYEPYLKGYGTFSKATAPFGPLIQYTIALGNDTTGTFYLMIFESPEQSWEEEFKRGSEIIEQMGLDAAF